MLLISLCSTDKARSELLARIDSLIFIELIESSKLLRRFETEILRYRRLQWKAGVKYPMKE